MDKYALKGAKYYKNEGITLDERLKELEKILTVREFILQMANSQCMMWPKFYQTVCTLLI